VEAAAPSPSAAPPATIAVEPADKAAPPAAVEPAIKVVPPSAAEPAAKAAPPAAAEPAIKDPPPSAAESKADPNAPPPSAASASESEASDPVLSGDRLLVAIRAKIAADELSSAEAMARRGVARDPDDHHAMEALVEVLIEETRGVEAVKYAVQIVRKRPKRASYRLLEGDARMLANDRVGAERAWREALALDPSNRDAKRRLGLPP
jgi:hypothetical protein